MNYEKQNKTLKEVCESILLDCVKQGCAFPEISELQNKTVEKWEGIYKAERVQDKIEEVARGSDVAAAIIAVHLEEARNVANMSLKSVWFSNSDAQLVVNNFKNKFKKCAGEEVNNG